MSKKAQRAWTDEEMGYVLSTLDRPRQEVAEQIGRSTQTISCMRLKVRRGWVRSLESWTLAENEILREHAGALSAKGLVKLLPGRSQQSIESQKHKLRIKTGPAVRNNPRAVGSRTLIARTCTVCGLLLPASWFSIKKRNGGRLSQCRKCSPAQKYANGTTVKTRRNSREYADKAQALTLETATRKGLEYTESDHAIMSDPTNTALSKALAMNRTYAATATALSANGYKSARALGDTLTDQWLIDNPNADRVDEITARLTKPELVSAGMPAWDWDD